MLSFNLMNMAGLDIKTGEIDIATAVPEDFLTLADGHDRIHDFSERIRILLIGLELFSYDYRILIEIGKTYYSTGDFLVARHCFDAILKAKPDAINALFYIMLIAHKTGNHEEMELYAKRIIDLNINDIRSKEKLVKAMSMLANFYIIRNRLVEAEELYVKALKLTPDDFLATYCLAKLTLRMGKTEMAKQLIGRAHKLMPDDHKIRELMTELGMK